jgi:hypothetical protein
MSAAKVFFGTMGGTYLYQISHAWIHAMVMPIVLFMLTMLTPKEYKSARQYYWDTLRWVVIFRCLIGSLTLYAHYNVSIARKYHPSTFMSYTLPVVYTAITEGFSVFYCITRVKERYDNGINGLRKFLLSFILFAVFILFGLYMTSCENIKKRKTILYCTVVHLTLLVVYIATDPYSYTLVFMFGELMISVYACRLDYTNVENWFTFILGLHCWFPYNNPLLAAIVNVTYAREVLHPTKKFTPIPHLTINKHPMCIGGTREILWGNTDGNREQWVIDTYMVPAVYQVPEPYHTFQMEYPFTHCLVAYKNDVNKS